MKRYMNMTLAVIRESIAGMSTADTMRGTAVTTRKTVSMNMSITNTMKEDAVITENMNTTNIITRAAGIFIASAAAMTMMMKMRIRVAPSKKS